MIRVDRDRCDENGKPIRPSNAWLQRASAATTRLVQEGGRRKVSDLYRDDEVRKALEKLFHRKCAYCESRLGTVDPENVEHFRPHGAVAERSDHPGYFWLAYTWANLYPACTYCNQKRRDRPSWSESVTGPPAGKATSFPLFDESGRAMAPTDELARERPLLLDPCSPDSDPEQRFRYDVRGEIHARIPTDVQARATIRIFHLRRRRLRDDRARVVQRISKLVRILEGLRAKLDSGDPTIVELQRLLDEQLGSEALYVGAARNVVRDPRAF